MYPSQALLTSGRRSKGHPEQSSFAASRSNRGGIFWGHLVKIADAEKKRNVKKKFRPRFFCRSKKFWFETQKRRGGTFFPFLFFISFIFARTRHLQLSQIKKNKTGLFCSGKLRMPSNQHLRILGWLFFVFLTFYWKAFFLFLLKLFLVGRPQQLSSKCSIKMKKVQIWISLQKNWKLVEKSENNRFFLPTTMCGVSSLLNLL